MKLLRELNLMPLRNNMNDYLIGTLTNLSTLSVREHKPFRTDDELKSYCAETYGTRRWTKLPTGGLKGWDDHKPILVVVSRPVALLATQAS